MDIAWNIVGRFFFVAVYQNVKVILIIVMLLLQNCKVNLSVHLIC